MSQIAKTVRLTSTLLLLGTVGLLTILWISKFDIGGGNYDLVMSYKNIILIVPVLLALPLAYHLAFKTQNPRKRLAICLLVTSPLVIGSLYLGVMSNCGGLGSAECPYPSEIRVINQ